MIHKNLYLDAVSLKRSGYPKYFSGGKKKKKKKKRKSKKGKKQHTFHATNFSEHFHNRECRFTTVRTHLFSEDLYLAAGSAANSISPPLARKRPLSINFDQGRSEILTSHCTHVSIHSHASPLPLFFFFFPFFIPFLSIKQATRFKVLHLQYQQDRRFLLN